MLDARPGRLIVACQPSSPSSPLNSPDHIVAMAIAADEAGASALLLDTPHHVISVKAASVLPVIGQWRRFRPDGSWTATPDLESAAALAAAGADLILLDATGTAHPDGEELTRFIGAIHRELRLPVVAAVGTLAEGERAAASGADAVAALSPVPAGEAEGPVPDLALVRSLVRAVTVPVLALGGYWEPWQARAALQIGAAFVIIGAPVTAPDLQAARFLARTAAPESAGSGGGAAAALVRYWEAAAAALAWVQSARSEAVVKAADLLVSTAKAGGTLHVLGLGPFRSFGEILKAGTEGLLPVHLLRTETLLTHLPGGGEWAPGRGDLLVVAAPDLAAPGIVALTQQALKGGCQVMAVSRVEEARLPQGGRSASVFLNLWVPVPGLTGSSGGQTTGELILTGDLLAQALAVACTSRAAELE